jgi:hypothetical protein
MSNVQCPMSFRLPPPPPCLVSCRALTCLEACATPCPCLAMPLVLWVMSTKLTFGRTHRGPPPSTPFLPPACFILLGTPQLLALPLQRRKRDIAMLLESSS